MEVGFLPTSTLSSNRLDVEQEDDALRGAGHLAECMSGMEMTPKDSDEALVARSLTAQHLGIVMT